MRLDSVFGRYDSSGVSEVSENDSSRGERDYRRACCVTYNSGRRLVIKIAKDCFTTGERIQGWNDLIERYNRAGIYAPKIVADTGGQICFWESGYMVYAEEYKRFLCADEFTPKVEPREYEADVYRMIGKIAALPPTIVRWNSAYSLYDTFCEEDFAAENYECAEEWWRIFQWAAPEKRAVVDQIWNTYLRIRQELETEYRALPKTAFQADLNHTNIMLDDKRHFAGIMDFKLSGTETILNYALCECVASITGESDLGELTSPEFLEQQDRILQRRMGFIKEHYDFSEAERQAYQRLYNMVVPFRWSSFAAFRRAVTRRQEEHYHDIVDWVAYQITRTDLSL